MVWVALAVIAYLLYRNYQLEKRWRALRYCWHCMSDFAGNRLKDDGCPDEDWVQTLREQRTFMLQFGVRPLSTFALDQYEEALVERKIEPLDRAVF
ncbi:MAG: hypothetical protein H2056_07800 [Sphingopyxis sp.]|nr:hypothetical protein [Sphingopyxis sp.]